MSLNKRAILAHIGKIYKKGGNIIEYLRSLNLRQKNTIEDILISYDFQAGTYTAKYEENPEFYEERTKRFAEHIKKLGLTNYSILEAGCGEARTLALVLKNLQSDINKALGFDISWSRIQYAKAFCNRQPLSSNPVFFTGDLFTIPLKDNSVDVVYTFFSIESNEGREKDAIAELYRVARSYVVLVEPAYELADEEGKRRMKKMGHITNLKNAIHEDGYTVVQHIPFAASRNPLNPTALTILKKEARGKINEAELVCPITYTPLTQKDNALFSPSSFLAYPMIRNTPCLTPENAILATHFQEFC